MSCVFLFYHAFQFKEKHGLVVVSPPSEYHFPDGAGSIELCGVTLGGGGRDCIEHSRDLSRAYDKKNSVFESFARGSTLRLGS